MGGHILIEGDLFVGYLLSTAAFTGDGVLDLRASEELAAWELLCLDIIYPYIRIYSSVQDQHTARL